jgi:hypothetical protein
MVMAEGYDFLFRVSLSNTSEIVPIFCLLNVNPKQEVDFGMQINQQFFSASAKVLPNCDFNTLKKVFWVISSCSICMSKSDK